MPLTRAATVDTLSKIMDFGRVIRVNGDGTVTDVDDVYPPDLYATEEDIHDPELSSQENWSLLNGYSGQYGYSGPIMHNSEFIGGGLARDILATPGVYVTIPCVWMDVPEGEDNIEGWAVARLDEDAPLPPRRPTDARSGPDMGGSGPCPL